MSPEQELDPKALAELRTIGGDQFVVEMLEVFLQYAPALLADARAGLAIGDLEPAQRAGHSLKSSASQVGALTVHELALRLERAAVGKQADAIPALLAQIEAACNPVQVCLEEERQRTGRPAP